MKGDIVRLTASYGNLELLELVAKVLDKAQELQVIKGPDLRKCEDNAGKYKRAYFDICKPQK